MAVTRVASLAQHVADDVAIEGELVLEVVVDHRLVHAGGAGDVVDADAVEAAMREARGGGGEDGGAGGARIDAFVRPAAAAGARDGGAGSAGSGRSFSRLFIVN